MRLGSQFRSQGRRAGNWVGSGLRSLNAMPGGQIGLTILKMDRWITAAPDCTELHQT